MPSFNVNPITLRYQGLFDFDGMYAAVIDWAKNYGYLWTEKAYKHKVPSPRGAEQELDWSMTTNITEYIRYTINFKIHIWDLNEVQVEVQGKTLLLSNARMYIEMLGTLEYDWQGKFKGSSFFDKLGNLYFKIMFKDISLKYADDLYYRIWNLHAVLKKYFDMQTKKYVYKNYLGES